MLVTMESAVSAQRLLHEKIARPKEPREPKEPKRPTKSQDRKEREQHRRKQQDRAAEKRKEVAAALAANKAKRLERKAKLKAKKAPPKPPGLNQIPAQVAHCMMAVHVKGKKSKRAAWNICRWSLSKNGYLKGPYRANTKLPKATKQTGKGVRRSFQHGMEKKPLGGGLPGTGTSKYAKFIKMFGALEPSLLPKGAK